MSATLTTKAATPQVSLNLENIANKKKALSPTVTYHFVDLPQTTLHYVKCGEGPPLIMVPATISEIDNWLPLAQFMGEYFTTYFFELPGHGQSTPFSEPFSSQLVAETVEAFINELGLETVTIMGFSFGGVLVMKTLYHLRERIERVVLIAPAASYRALPFSSLRLHTLRSFISLLRRPAACRGLVRLIQNKSFSWVVAKSCARIGKVEDNVKLTNRFAEIQPHTFEVLANQMHEVLYLEHPVSNKPFSQPCFFAMSEHDPLLDFDTTLKVLQGQFDQVHVTRLEMPYHQPPKPPTLDELMRDYGGLLEAAL